MLRTNGTRRQFSNIFRHRRRLRNRSYGAAIEPLEVRALLTQAVAPNPIRQSVTPDAAAEFAVGYSTDDDR